MASCLRLMQGKGHKEWGQGYELQFYRLTSEGLS